MMDSDQNLKVWREEVGRRFLHLDFKPVDATAPLQIGVSVVHQSRDVTIGNTSHTPGQTFRDREMIAESGDDKYTLLLPRSGRLTLRHVSREVEIRPGEAALLRNSEPGLVASADSPCSYTAVMVEPALLKTLGADASYLLVRRLPSASAALKLLRKYLACLSQSANGFESGLGEAIGRHAAELVASTVREALSAQEPRPGPSLKQVRLELALAYIHESFTNPALSAGKIASNQGVSKRYLQRLFEEAGIQYIPLLNELRLSKAHCDLRDPSQSGRSIANIALGAGFSDISHFNRLFRQRYDSTPTAVRSQRRSV